MLDQLISRDVAVVCLYLWENYLFPVLLAINTLAENEVHKVVGPRADVLIHVSVKFIFLFHQQRKTVLKTLACLIRVQFCD